MKVDIEFKESDRRKIKKIFWEIQKNPVYLSLIVSIISSVISGLIVGLMLKGCR